MAVLHIRQNSSNYKNIIQKHFTTEDTESTEFYFVNNAAGVVNKENLCATCMERYCCKLVGRALPAFFLNMTAFWWAVPPLPLFTKNMPE